MRSEKNTEAIDRVQRFLARAYSRAALPYLTVGLLLIVVIVVAGREIEHHINAIESCITKLGPWGVFAFVGLFILATSFLLPDTVLCIVAGALFGMFWSVAAVLAGSNARTAHLHDLAIIGGLVVCVAVMVLVSRMARKAVMQAVAVTEKAWQSTIKP